MSTQRGNTSRQRPQKHKNVTAFRNDLHDKSPKMQLINNIDVANVCRKCANILEWKIRYKKYKPLKAPRKCTKCEQKCVKCAYHIMCMPCAESSCVCPKCGKSEEIVKASATSKEDQFKLDQEMQQMIKSLSERKRRTFLRYMSKQCGADKPEKSDSKDMKKDLMDKLESLKVEDGCSDLFDDDDDDDDDDDEDEEEQRDGSNENEDESGDD